MSEQLQLASEERTVSAARVRQLRHEGMVPANICGQGQPTVALQISMAALQKLLARGGNNIILLKVGEKPPVQALIKHVQRNAVSGKVIHVDFLRLAAAEKIRTNVQLHYVNEDGAAGRGHGTVSRLMNQVMVECLPIDLPTGIQVDLSQMKGPEPVLRVGDLQVESGITILTDHNELVAAIHKQARAEKTEDGGETSVAAGAPATTPLP